MQFYCVINKNEILFINSVGKKLREKRLAKNLSQVNLASDANIPESQIGRIERGEINTTIGTLFKICNALGIEFKELIE
ncbi:helix-turn-helix domain-containing protein [Flavobacterium aestivum]|uniref:helix-turn-helix domain-containing protein n=1 Tax=Flavobacterium aestivum TaxID=3003257 RepID=UPI002482114F|nr:helix-turn-helix transcriptional regulator [Flavobacterium aestivum]